jgi:hypothetical protein
MTMKRNAIALAMCLAAAACATPYQESGLTGGVTAHKEADGTWLILAAGNGYTSVEAISDYTFLKAAETVKAQGFVCFEIVGQYAAMQEDTMPSQYGTMIFQKPAGRLRIRIREDLKTCDDATNADAIIARLKPKIKNPNSYHRED